MNEILKQFWYVNYNYLVKQGLSLVIIKYDNYFLLSIKNMYFCG